MVDKIVASIAAVLIVLFYLKYDRVQQEEKAKAEIMARAKPLADTASDLIPYCYHSYDGGLRKAPCESNAPRTQMTSGPALVQHGPLHSDLVKAVPWQEIQHGSDVHLDVPQYAFPNTMIWN